MNIPTPIDWIAKLRHLLQTLAFSLAISAAQYALHADRPYEVPLVYSLAIGTVIWAWIDFGRHVVPSSAETGWPRGGAGLALVASGIAAGYTIGTLVGDAWFGWSSWGSADGRKLQPASALVTVLAGIAGAYYFYSVNKSAWLQRKMLEARQRAGEARLKLLEAQLEPHMLFNTLANLRALIGADPPRATLMLDHLIAYLRATLDASRATTHPLGAEFERLADYLELMAIRMGARLAFTLDLPAELAAQPVPTLLLQPLVENSIRHGLEPKVGGGSVRVSARREGASVVLEVSDTGVGADARATAMSGGGDGGRGGGRGDGRDGGRGDGGIDGDPRATGSVDIDGNARAGRGARAAAGHGFGLAQVRERLATLYGPAARLEFAATVGPGTRAVIYLPAQP